MTPNKPEVEVEARELVSISNSAIENQTLRLIARLAKTITYNAEAMNKLVNRVDELEKLVANSKPVEKTVTGYTLDVLLTQPSVERVKCVKSNSSLWVEGKTYVVLQSTADVESRKVKAETGRMLNTSVSLFIEVVKPVIGHKLQVLLAKPEVVTVRCVKTNSRLWTEGHEYRVVWNKGKRMVMCDQKHHVKETTSLFVAVDEQREPFKEPFKLDFYRYTQYEANWKAAAEQRFTAHLRHHQFMEVSRMFMGLPTVQLIHPRSL